MFPFLSSSFLLHNFSTQHFATFIALSFGKCLLVLNVYYNNTVAVVEMLFDAAVAIVCVSAEEEVMRGGGRLCCGLMVHLSST